LLLLYGVILCQSLVAPSYIA